jgi:hypothetical protein
MRQHYETKGDRTFLFREVKLRDKIDSDITPGQKEYKTYYYDRHTIYVNNNGHNETEVLRRLRGALSHAPHRVNTPLPENHHILTSTFVKRTETGIKGQKGHRDAEDKTLVYFYDSRDYDYLLGIDSTTGHPFVTLEKVRTGECLSSDLKASMNREASQIILGTGIGSWADEEDDQDALVWKYYLLAHPLQYDGITNIPREFRKSWRSHLSRNGDIGILRCTATMCRPEYYENRLVIQNVPTTWSEEEIKTYFSKFSTSNNPVYPHFEFKKTKESKDLVIMTFDPEHKEAMFAQQLLRDAKVYIKGINKMVDLHCVYYYIHPKEGNKQKGGVFIIRPPKQNKQLPSIDNDGFRSYRK